MFDLTAGTHVQALESALQFSWRRHEVILNNVANVSTPGFVASDLPVDQFNAALAKAIRRSDSGGPVVLGSSMNTNVLPPFHNLEARSASAARRFAPFAQGDTPGPDSNNVQPELEAAKLAKNAARFTALSQLLTRHFDLLETAIRERL